MSEQETSPESQFPLFKPGLYFHFKGNYYIALRMEGGVVCYKSLEPKPGEPIEHPPREYDDFYAWVNPVTREVVEPESPGSVPRFEYLGDPGLVE